MSRNQPKLSKSNSQSGSQQKLTKTLSTSSENHKSTKLLTRADSQHSLTQHSGAILHKNVQPVQKSTLSQSRTASAQNQQKEQQIKQSTSKEVSPARISKQQKIITTGNATITQDIVKSQKIIKSKVDTGIKKRTGVLDSISISQKIERKPSRSKSREKQPEEKPKQMTIAQKLAYERSKKLAKPTNSGKVSRNSSPMSKDSKGSSKQMPQNTAKTNNKQVINQKEKQKEDFQQNNIIQNQDDLDQHQHQVVDEQQINNEDLFKRKKPQITITLCPDSDIPFSNQLPNNIKFQHQDDDDDNDENLVPDDDEQNEQDEQNEHDEHDQHNEHDNQDNDEQNEHDEHDDHEHDEHDDHDEHDEHNHTDDRLNDNIQTSQQFNENYQNHDESESNKFLNQDEIQCYDNDNEDQNNEQENKNDVSINDDINQEEIEQKQDNENMIKIEDQIIEQIQNQDNQDTQIIDQQESINDQQNQQIIQQEINNVEENKIEQENLTIEIMPQKQQIPQIDEIKTQRVDCEQSPQLSAQSPDINYNAERLVTIQEEEDQGRLNTEVQELSEQIELDNLPDDNDSQIAKIESKKDLEFENNLDQLNDNLGQINEGEQKQSFLKKQQICNDIYEVNDNLQETFTPIQQIHQDEPSNIEQINFELENAQIEEYQQIDLKQQNQEQKLNEQNNDLIYNNQEQVNSQINENNKNQVIEQQEENLEQFKKQISQENIKIQQQLQQPDTIDQEQIIENEQTSLNLQKEGCNNGNVQQKINDAENIANVEQIQQINEQNELDIKNLNDSILKQASVTTNSKIINKDEDMNMANQEQQLNDNQQLKQIVETQSQIINDTQVNINQLQNENNLNQENQSNQLQQHLQIKIQRKQSSSNNTEQENENKIQVENLQNSTNQQKQDDEDFEFLQDLEKDFVKNAIADDEEEMVSPDNKIPQNDDQNQSEFKVIKVQEQNQVIAESQQQQEEENQNNHSQKEIENQQVYESPQQVNDQQKNNLDNEQANQQDEEEEEFDFMKDLEQQFVHVADDDQDEIVSPDNKIPQNDDQNQQEFNVIKVQEQNQVIAESQQQQEEENKTNHSQKEIENQQIYESPQQVNDQQKNNLVNEQANQQDEEEEFDFMKDLEQQFVHVADDDQDEIVSPDNKIPQEAENQVIDAEQNENEIKLLPKTNLASQFQGQELSVVEEGYEEKSLDVSIEKISKIEKQQGKEAQQSCIDQQKISLFENLPKQNDQQVENENLDNEMKLQITQDKEKDQSVQQNQQEQKSDQQEGNTNGNLSESENQNSFDEDAQQSTKLDENILQPGEVQNSQDQIIQKIDDNLENQNTKEEENKIKDLQEDVPSQNESKLEENQQQDPNNQQLNQNQQSENLFNTNMEEEGQDLKQDDSLQVKQNNQSVDMQDQKIQDENEILQSLQREQCEQKPNDVIESEINLQDQDQMDVENHNDQENVMEIQHENIQQEKNEENQEEKQGEQNQKEEVQDQEEQENQINETEQVEQAEKIEQVEKIQQIEQVQQVEQIEQVEQQEQIEQVQELIEQPINIVNDKDENQENQENQENLKESEIHQQQLQQNLLKESINESQQLIADSRNEIQENQQQIEDIQQNEPITYRVTFSSRTEQQESQFQNSHDNIKNLMISDTYEQHGCPQPNENGDNQSFDIGGFYQCELKKQTINQEIFNPDNINLSAQFKSLNLENLDNQQQNQQTEFVDSSRFDNPNNQDQGQQNTYQTPQRQRTTRSEELQSARSRISHDLEYKDSPDKQQSQLDFKPEEFQSQRTQENFSKQEEFGDTGRESFNYVNKNNLDRSLDSQDKKHESRKSSLNNDDNQGQFEPNLRHHQKIPILKIPQNQNYIERDDKMDTQRTVESLINKFGQQSDHDLITPDSEHQRPQQVVQSLQGIQMRRKQPKPLDDLFDIEESQTPEQQARSVNPTPKQVDSRKHKPNAMSFGLQQDFNKLFTTESPSKPASGQLSRQSPMNQRVELLQISQKREEDLKKTIKQEKNQKKRKEEQEQRERENKILSEKKKKEEELDQRITQLEKELQLQIELNKTRDQQILEYEQTYQNYVKKIDEISINDNKDEESSCIQNTYNFIDDFKNQMFEKISNMKHSDPIVELMKNRFRIIFKEQYRRNQEQLQFQQIEFNLQNNCKETQTEIIDLRIKTLVTAQPIYIVLKEIFDNLLTLRESSTNVGVCYLETQKETYENMKKLSKKMIYRDRIKELSESLNNQIDESIKYLNSHQQTFQLLEIRELLMNDIDVQEKLHNTIISLSYIFKERLIQIQNGEKTMKENCQSIFKNT